MQSDLHTHVASAAFRYFVIEIPGTLRASYIDKISALSGINFSRASCVCKTLSRTSSRVASKNVPCADLFLIGVTCVP